MKGFKVGIVAVAVIAAIVGGSYYVASSKARSAYNETAHLISNKIEGVTLISSQANFGLLGGTALTKYRIDPNVAFSASNNYSSVPVFLDVITKVDTSNPFKVKSITNFDFSGVFFDSLTNELSESGTKFTMNNHPFSITNKKGDFKLPLVITTVNNAVLVKIAGVVLPGKLKVSPINVRYVRENNQDRLDINIADLYAKNCDSELRLANLSLKIDDLLNTDKDSDSDSISRKFAQGNSALNIGELSFKGLHEKFSFINASLLTNYKIVRNLADMGSTLTVGTLNLPLVNLHRSLDQISNIKIKAELSGIDYKFWDELSNIYSNAVLTQSHTQFTQWLQNNRVNLYKMKVKELSFSGDFTQGNVKGKLTADLNDSVTNVRFDNLDKTIRSALIFDFRASIPMTLGEDLFNRNELQDLIMKKAVVQNGDRLETHIKLKNGTPEFISEIN